MFAALHPEHVNGLVLVNTTARYSFADDYPIGLPSGTIDELVEVVATSWGTTDFSKLINPGAPDDDPIHEIGATHEARFSATPRDRGRAVRLPPPKRGSPRGTPARPGTHARAPCTGESHLAARTRGLSAEHIARATLIELPGGCLPGDPAP